MLRPDVPGPEPVDAAAFQIPFRRCRSYGHTLLTRPLRWTDDPERAARSPFVYGPGNVDWPGVAEYEGWYHTSVLGIVNGVLRFTGFRITVYVTGPDHNGGRWIVGTALRWFGWRT